VRDGLSREAVAAWPQAPGGLPDIGAVAARHQLSATFLPETSLVELRAIALPALIDLAGADGRRPYLLRAVTDDGVVLVTPEMREIRQPARGFEEAWNRTAWILWWNVDQLPENPSREMTVPVTAAVARRLQSLGHLAPPLPARHDGRFQEAVKAFQASIGLPPDGILGPRTTLALSRVIAGKFGPATVWEVTRSR
jgi:hypothetical protein